MRAMQTPTYATTIRTCVPTPNDPYALPYSVLPEGGIRESRVVQDYVNSFKFDLDYHQPSASTTSSQLLVWSSIRGMSRITGISTTVSSTTWAITPTTSPTLSSASMSRGKDYYTIRNKANNNLGFLTRASYTYDDRYSIDALLRFDASNRFGPSRYVRWLPTWNVELTWGVDRESFFRHLKPLSSMRLKTYVGLVADNPSVTNSLEEIYPNIPRVPARRKSLWRIATSLTTT